MDKRQLAVMKAIYRIVQLEETVRVAVVWCQCVLTSCGTSSHADVHMPAPQVFILGNVHLARLCQPRKLQKKISRAVGGADRTVASIFGEIPIASRKFIASDNVEAVKVGGVVMYRTEKSVGS